MGNRCIQRVDLETFILKNKEINIDKSINHSIEKEKALKWQIEGSERMQMDEYLSKHIKINENISTKHLTNIII